MSHWCKIFVVIFEKYFYDNFRKKYFYYNFKYFIPSFPLFVLRQQKNSNKQIFMGKNRNEEILIFQYLLRCSFHAYADSTYAKHLENGASLYGTVGAPTPTGTFQPNGEVPREFQQSVMEMSDDSMTSLDPHQLHHAAAAGAAGPHDWAGPAGGQLVQTTANISPVVAGAGAELRPANGGVFGHNQQQQQQQDNGECGAGPACSVASCYYCA